MAAQELLQRALKRYKKNNHGKIDIAMLAKSCGLPYSTVYNPLFLGRKPSADIWLKLMEGLGAVSGDRAALHIRKVS